jgi:hypothetical protein
VDGRFEGGYTGLFELICPGCGDHPYLDYSEIPPRLQWLRGPRLLEAALKAYDKHLGPPGTNGDSAGSLGPGWTTAQEHLIRRLCRAHPLLAHSAADLRNSAHWCAVGGSVERSYAAKKRPEWPGNHVGSTESSNL